MNKSSAVETPRKENQILLEGEKKASCRKWPWAGLADRARDTPSQLMPRRKTGVLVLLSATAQHIYDFEVPK